MGQRSRNCLILLVFLVPCFYGAAQQEDMRTDEAEVKALQAFATKLGITQRWNFSVDPCSGLYGWNNTSGVDTFQPASGVECDCSANTSICHITKIAVVDIDAAGEIAPEIGNFSFLNTLNLAQNVITGTLPDEIGSLSRMQFFTVGINKLTGPLPASIGKLTQLVSIGIGTNYFSGSLPKEIGNLKSMASLYMDSSGLSGELPPELSGLKSLTTLWMSDNNFTGSLDFLGNLSALKEVTMNGNNFRGPIPSTLGNLPNLKTLHIGDISSGGRIPDTLNKLTKLTELSLRNCELSGPIPELNNLTGLLFLDLSFNNLSGEIPPSLGSLSSLETLLLASNNLTGALPSQLGTLSNLQRLDLSFNSFTGLLPMWLNRTQLQENVVWNRFNTSTSQRLNGPETNCLEGRLGCGSVDEGKNFQLDINCGGPRFTSSRGTTFTEDMSTLADFTSYSNSSQSWAVSSTGYASGFNTIATTSRRVIGTTDSSLYQTARSSPSSLKYFGLGMFNGQYQVELHFVEIVIDDNTTGWTGLGRRFFDVYIQGSRVLQDFNIQAEAKGSYRALVRNFTALVSDNVLHIHFLWRGKGTCCSPAPNSFGPLISAIRVIPGFHTNGLGREPASSNSFKAAESGIGVGISIFVLLAFVVVLVLIRRRRNSKKYLQDKEDLKSLEGKPKLFTYNDLKLATRGFVPENKLGEGGFGSVFRGVLHDGTVVAIKELSSKSNQGTREFLNEVTVISAVQHRNLVKLHGCCIEGSHRLLVYEFLENNSLHQALLSPNDRKLHLDWPTRFNICIGIARGIAYLHEESLPMIVHRDIKASNVLLDRTLNAKIADFGLAKLFDDQQTHVSTRVAGTIGYLSPEYAMRGQLTEKADVYSFGVLALEIVSGRQNLDMSLPGEMVYLLEWAWQLYERQKPMELLDPGAEDFSQEEVLRVIQVALLCSQAVASARPRMSQVVAMLLGTAPIDVGSLLPGYFSALKSAAPGFFTDAALKFSSRPQQGLQRSSVVSEEEEALSSSMATFDSNISMGQPR